MNDQDEEVPFMVRKWKWFAGGAVLAILSIVLATRMFKAVPSGHVGVATLFGKVQDVPYSEGFHVLNPLMDLQCIDVRQKSHKETANVPSQDQLTTEVDASIQYRIIAGMAPSVLRDTGDAQAVVNVHLVPKLRSIMREQGKAVEKAEMYFTEGVQRNMQAALLSELKEFCASKGILVEEVFLRDFRLPPFIIQAIQQKKQREQKAEEQKAELERFRTEQEQKVAQAMAERKAADEEAMKMRVLADAKAYEIDKINTAIANNPAYVQLQALEALKAISTNPSTQIYFMDGASTSPIPLMNIGGAKK